MCMLSWMLWVANIAWFSATRTHLTCSCCFWRSCKWLLWRLSCLYEGDEYDYSIFLSTMNSMNSIKSLKQLIPQRLADHWLTGQAVWSVALSSATKFFAQEWITEKCEGYVRHDIMTLTWLSHPTKLLLFRKKQHLIDAVNRSYENAWLDEQTPVRKLYFR